MIFYEDRDAGVAIGVGYIDLTTDTGQIHRFDLTVEQMSLLHSLGKAGAEWEKVLESVLGGQKPSSVRQVN